MLNYVETASRRTIVPLESIPCSQFQDTAVTTFSYVIGPIDAAQIITMQAQLSSGDACSLLVPVHLPRLIFDHPTFHDGYTYSFLSDEQEDWSTSVTRLINHVYSSLTDTHLFRDVVADEVIPDFLPWQVGWLLRDLTRLAETDRLLAYTGIAHLCFLLPLLTQGRPANWPRYEPYHACILHDRAVKAFRGRIRVYQEQGKSYNEAQRLALVL
jgi:hypothetical protein